MTKLNNRINNSQNNEIHAVQGCMKLALELELQLPATFEKGDFAAPSHIAKLDELKKELWQLGSFDSPKLKKLSEIANHLNEKMSAQHFSNYIIPLERFLDRTLRDDDFLVSTDDLKLDPNTELPKRRPIVFVLDNIRSAFNVGSIIRLADCVGSNQVILCGYTPGFQMKNAHISQGFEAFQQKSENKIHPTVMKTSLNAAQYVKINSYQKIEEAIQKLKKDNYKIIALETSKNSKSIYEEPLSGPVAFLVGNERFGLDSKVLSLADEVRHIPMFGVKNSLNVSNAITAAAFEWSRQNP